MEDLQALRETIATLLADYLGTYTYSNGLTTPAIAIDDGSQPTSDTGQQLAVEDAAVTGLEVLIVPGRSLGLTNFLAGDRRVDLGTDIILKQWDIAQTTRAAREVLIVNLDDIDSVRIQQRSTRLDTIETTTFTLSNSFHLLRSSR